MVKIGEEISTAKGKGIVRGIGTLDDERKIVYIENKNNHLFPAIEGDDF